MIELAVSQGYCGPGLINFSSGVITVLSQMAWACEGREVGTNNTGVFIFVSAIIAINMIAAFFISALIRAMVISFVIKDPKIKIRKTIWIANIVSYVFLILSSLIFLAIFYLK